MEKKRCQQCGIRITGQRSTKRYCSDTCRVAAHRRAKPNKIKVYSAVRGTNAKLIARVASLYISRGETVADVTYGHGVFWRLVNTDNFTLLKSDIVSCPDAPFDFRALPYNNHSLDHVVLDPPYAHTPGKLLVDLRYRNRETTKNLYHTDIMTLYREGIAEASRVLRSGGLLWCKCQDEIESGAQQWSHIELYTLALTLGFSPKDLFILVSGSPPIQYRQQHARRNHSYLWIFQKKG
jgi:hypothetical protein